MIYVTYAFYKKNIQIERQMLPFIQKTAQNKVIDAVLQGITIGLLGSWFMQVVGLPLEVTKACIILLPIALLLSLQNPRFACFSYATPILGIISFFIPNFKLDIPGLISLVGSLHLMEAVLVYLTGAQDSVPVIVKQKGNYVGAYIMQKYWPIPIALKTPLQGFTPLCGILGFASIAITTTPKKKARKMGLLIGLYALLILVGAKIASVYPVYKIPILFIMPLFHEIIYYLDHHFENIKPPLYTNPSNGIRVLDVLYNSLGWEMGIKRGDIIHRINNYDIKNPPDYYKILKQGHHKIRLTITHLNGKQETLQCTAYNTAITELGIVPLPTYSVIIQTI